MTSQLRAVTPGETAATTVGPAHTAGSVKDYAHQVAAALNGPSGPVWTVEEVRAGRMFEDSVVWDIVATFGQATCRLLVRRQWNDPGRVNVVFDLPIEAKGRRGYYLSTTDNAALKTLTGAITVLPANMARRIERRLVAYVDLLDRIAVWSAERNAGAERRDKLAEQIVSLYGGYARGVGEADAGGVTIYPGVSGRDTSDPDRPTLRSIEVNAEGTRANIELRDLPTSLLGKVIDLVRNA